MRNRSNLAALIGALCLASGAASAQTAALCDFVKQVMATQPMGFDPLKGEAQNPALFHNEVFHGALVPTLDANCTLFLKSQAGRVTLPPRYSCTIARADDFAAANRIFQRSLQELRACFAGAMFATKYDGDGKDPDEVFDWTATAQIPGFEFQLEMSNGLAALAAALSQNDPNAPHIAIDLDVTDISEEKDSVRRVLAIAAVLAVPGGAASAQTADFCDFVKKIVAAVPDEFAAYKAGSAIDSEGIGHSKGVLNAAGNYDCAIYPRAGEKGGIEREPNVSCRFGTATPFRSESDFTAPNGVFERSAAALRACLTALKFDERVFGDATHPAVNLQRMISVDLDEYRVLLQLTIAPTAAGPATSIGLVVTDHMPPKQ